MSRPAIQMLRYQQRYIDDKARRKIALKARQIGFSFCSLYEAVETGLAAGPRNDWYYLSTNEDKAVEAIHEAQKHAKAFRAATRIIAEDFVWEGERFKTLQLELPTRVRIKGLPANERTARGSNGNIILDEFAHHQKPSLIFSACYPFITRGHDRRLIVQSTPRGKSGKFYELWTHGKGWSRHRVDIFDAVRQGLDANIEELHEGLGNEDDWQQEYCCVFLDEAHAWLPYDLIDAVESRQAQLELPELDEVEGRPYTLGIDIGRTKDLTVLWLLEQVGDVHWTRGVRVLEKTPFRDQLTAMHELMPKVRRCCIDAGLMGMPLAEELQQRWGTHLVEGVNMGAKVKEDLATHLHTMMEDRRVRIPVDSKLRADLHSVKKVVTSTGHVRFDAERSDLGHADRFWALSLALQAARTDHVSAADYETVQPMTFGGIGYREDRMQPDDPFGAHERPYGGLW